MKKIKVTKRVRAKVPWYEKPPLLFGAIALLLVIAGVLMAQITSRGGGDTSLGQEGAGDSAAVALELSKSEEVSALSYVLGPDSSIPTVAPGGLLPPIRAETLPDAAKLRQALRRARNLQSLGTEGGVFAFVDVSKILETADVGAGDPQAWERLPLSSEQRAWCDFELHQPASGERYLIAFVSVRVAEALGSLAPGLQLAPPDDAGKVPWWQFWKRRQEPDEIILRPGSRIDLYPDISPETNCLVALPVARIVPVGLRRVRTGLPAALEILEVELQ